MPQEEGMKSMGIRIAGRNTKDSIPRSALGIGGGLRPGVVWTAGLLGLSRFRDNR
jgi:hypothetical protein